MPYWQAELVKAGSSFTSRSTSNLLLTSAKIKHVSELSPPRKETRLTMNNFSLERRVPDYLPNGIFEAKFVADLQNKVPSVVVYCWNLNNCENKDKACLAYINNYKSNEKILGPWGISSFVLVCYDQASLAVLNTTEIENLIKSTVQHNKYFFRTLDELDNTLTEWK